MKPKQTPPGEDQREIPLRAPPSALGDKPRQYRAEEPETDQVQFNDWASI